MIKICRGKSVGQWESERIKLEIVSVGISKYMDFELEAALPGHYD